jgi:hypothetical protein
MQFKNSIFAPALLALLFAGPVWADDDELEITMELMDDADDQFINELTLDELDDEEFESRAGFLSGLFGGEESAGERPEEEQERFELAADDGDDLLDDGDDGDDRDDGDDDRDFADDLINDDIREERNETEFEEGDGESEFEEGGDIIEEESDDGSEEMNEEELIEEQASEQQELIEDEISVDTEATDDEVVD